MYSDDSMGLEDDILLDSPLDHLHQDPAPVSSPDPDEMLEQLRSPDANLRMMATRAFCDLEDGRAIPHLIVLLQDACPLIRVSAAYALGRNPSPEAVVPLINQLAQDWNGYVRKGVVWALGNCRDARALAPLITALQSDIAAVRLWAASALGQMVAVSPESATQAIPPLCAALANDPQAVVRSNSAWALGQLSRDLPLGQVYDTSVAALIAALEDTDLGVQEDARAALVKLGDPQGLQAIAQGQQDDLL